MKVGCSINRRGGHLWFALAAMSCALSLFSSAAYGQPGQAAYDVVTAFDVPKGVAPYGELIRATDGNFYGTTSAGGAFGLGTVFKMDPAGTLTTLHSFKGEDGSNPRAGLIQAVDGSFYGTTESGGDGNENGPSQYKGTVFRIDAAGQLTTLHRFTYSDGISLNG